jgi:hypothetical protein
MIMSTNECFLMRNRKWAWPVLGAGIGAGASYAAMAVSGLGLQGTMTSVCAWMSSLVPAAAGFKFAATVAGAAIAGSLIGLAVGLSILALYSIYKCCKGTNNPERSNAGAPVVHGSTSLVLGRDSLGGFPPGSAAGAVGY